MRVSAAKMKIKKISCSVFPAIVFIIYAMVSFAACTIGDNTISDEYGNMNITYGEDGIIRNGTEYYTYQVEDGYSGVVSVCIAKKAGRIDIDIYPKYSLQGTTQGRYLTGGVPPVRFSM